MAVTEITNRFPGITPQEAEAGGFTEEEIEELLPSILQTMTETSAELSVYREYYEGDQALTYGSEKFKNTFGDQFKQYRDNWCGVVADAVLDRLKFTGIRIGSMDDDNEERARRIWETFQLNDIDEQQRDGHEAGVVEGKFAVIVWPDPILGARIDWNLGGMVHVMYDDNDERKPILAVKRWITNSNEIWVNVYTPGFLWKYKQVSSGQNRRVTRSILGSRTSNPSGGIEPRQVAGELWPLPNPFGVVPVVEFNNRRGSEIHDVIPQQDAINYMMIQTMVAGEYSSFRQRVMMTGARPPVEGWRNVPGQVWRLPPTLDAEGKQMQSEIGEFSAADLSQFRQVLDMMLMHVALTSKTPVRYFFTSDRGGRGDAPSGESLKVEDGPLNNKVEDTQIRFGNRWWNVAKLVAIAIDSAGPVSYEEFQTYLGTGEVLWQHPQSNHRSALLDEAEKMLAIGVPREFLWRHIGLTQDEIEEVERMAEEAQAEAMRMQNELSSTSDPSSDPSSSSNGNGSESSIDANSAS